MAQRLGEILLQDGRITLAQLEEALRSQVVLGGRLGTNLVEMEAVTLDDVARALSKQHGVPPVLQGDYDQIIPEVVGRVPAHLAKRYQAIPLRVISHAPKVMAVAFMDPGKIAALDEFRFALGLRRVQVSVAPELRILYGLEKLYGIPRPARYLRYKPAPQPEPPSPREVAEPVLSTAEKEGPAEALPENPAASPRVLDLNSALQALNAAQTREEIGDILVDWLRSTVGCALVLIVRSDLALGWKGFAPLCDATTVASIAIPLGPSTAFRLAKEHLDVFRGAAPRDGAGLQERLWKLLRSDAPKEIIVAPVVLKNHVVNLVYAHATTAAGLPDSIKTDLSALCSSAALAYARLIQSAKRPSAAP